jgi:hypothetical protein
LITVVGNSVYVLGVKNSTQAPIYWANGAWHDLAIPVNHTWGWNVGIVVSGGSVYVAGTVKDTSSNQIPGYWKDGTWNTLGGVTAGYVSGIACSGNDVYIAGVDDTAGTPVYWKNGQINALPLGTANTHGWISGNTGSTIILAKGADIYIAGMAGGSSTMLPTVWKNGSILWQGTGANYFATSIAVSGSDVYLAGATENGPTGSSTPVYWKNGVMTTLVGYSGSQATPNFIAVGASVYCAGKSTYYNSTDPLSPLCWAGGSLVGLSLGGQPNGGLNGMAAAGNDVYLIGTTGTVKAGGGDFDYSLQTYGAYWKNGIYTQLGTGTHTASGTGGVFVTEE